MNKVKSVLTMRITGGKFCNRRVEIPQGDLEIRPAMDRMRESLFSILGPLENISFCDLFSGSGCIGLEAASRGANLVHLVELDGAKRVVMEKNIAFAKDDCNIRIYIEDVFEFIKLSKNSYDILYADPPFPMDNKIEIARLAQSCKRVVPGGLFIIHIPKTEEHLWEEKIGTFTKFDNRTYGRNTFLFYRNNQESK